jgi:hypothetical protein
MTRQPRKRTTNKSAIRPMQNKHQMQSALADDPRVCALRRRRWAHLRALAKDDAFRDATEAVRSDLNAAYGFDPVTVDAFMPQFWYPSPAVYLKARQFLERIQGSALRAALLRYHEYASRFGVYMVRRARKERTKFAVRGIAPRGEKFHVRVVEDHLEPAAGMPEDEPFVEYFSNDMLPVVPELQKPIGEGAARYVEIEDDSFSTILSELEEFAYSPDAITFIVHRAERRHLLCLVGEAVTQPQLRAVLPAVSAILRKHYNRGKAGRPRDRLREKKAQNLLRKPGRKGEIAHALAKGGLAKDHFSAERYARQVAKRNRPKRGR